MFRSVPARTLTGSVALSGHGLHSGAPCAIRLEAAEPATGLVFARGEQQRRLSVVSTRASPGSTSVRLDPPVHVVEHLAAALVALGVTDARIEVEGPELPALDGAAAVFYAAIVEAGTEVHGRTVGWQVEQPVEVEGFGGRACWRPAPDLEVSVVVDFGERVRGSAEWAAGQPASWLGARTFCFAEDVQALQAAGRGLGASVENTRVIDSGLPEGPSEPVLHKLLDAVGDVAIVGLPILGRLEVERGSHRLHRLAHQALAAVIASAEATA